MSGVHLGFLLPNLFVAWLLSALFRAVDFDAIRKIPFAARRRQAGIDCWTLISPRPKSWPYLTIFAPSRFSTTTSGRTFSTSCAITLFFPGVPHPSLLKRYS